MNKVLASVTVHYKNGEKQTLALLETDRDFVIAPYFNEEKWEWSGNGRYLCKHLNYTTCDVLAEFENRVRIESDSLFVDKITF